MGRRLGVVGQPIGHSRSPALFRAAFERLGVDGSYVRLAARSAEQALQLRRQLGLGGLNVTAPFKQAMAAHMDQLDEAATAIGAVNTVVARPGELWGSNTDPAGVLGALSAAGVEPAGRHAVILGAGGAGRAAAWALRQAGAGDIVLLNRTPERAAQAAAALGCRHAAWAQLEPQVRRAALLICCLPAGVDPVQDSWLDHGPAVLDANYGASPLSKRARAAGCVVADGAHWLRHQAAAAFERLTTTPADEAALLDAMAQALGSAEPPKPNVALIGFMGAGKSTLGPLLAQQLGMAFVDTDAECVRRAGDCIAGVFEQRGEAEFRAIERQVLAQIPRQRDTVFALGGGALSDARSMATVRAGCWAVWLWGPLELCLSRAARSGTERPLCQPGDEPTMGALLAERSDCYAQAAELVVSVEGCSPGDLAVEVADEMRRAGYG